MVILFNIHGYMFLLILFKLAIVILHNFTFNGKLCKHNGIPLGEHFIYLNSVTFWHEDGLK